MSTKKKMLWLLSLLPFFIACGDDNTDIPDWPATVAELRKRIHLAEGGDTYLFASTLNYGQIVLIRCEKV